MKALGCKTVARSNLALPRTSQSNMYDFQAEVRAAHFLVWKQEDLPYRRGRLARPT